ncbi:MAG: hypothetical protein ACTSVV_09560 [Promethearchaeota archaeon]
MKEKGLIYHGILDINSLKNLIITFFNQENTFCISQSEEDFNFYENISFNDNFPPIGQIFSEKGEIRWNLLKNDYSVLLFTEEEFNHEDFNLIHLDEDWTIEKNALYLYPLNIPQISPSINNYPKQKENKTPKLKVNIYYKNEMATFISPRWLYYE